MNVPLSASERQSGVVLGVTRDKKFLGQAVEENRTSSPNGPSFVNRLHDFLGPADRVRDCANRRRNSLPELSSRHRTAPVFGPREYSPRLTARACAPRPSEGVYYRFRCLFANGLNERPQVWNHRCEILGWPAKSLKDMVARDGVEPPTPAFSGLRSTT